MAMSAAEIVEEALREIGAYSVYDTGAKSEEFDVALRRFNILLQQLVGTRKLWFFTPATQEIALEADKSEYNLDAYVDIDLQMVNRAYVRNANGNTDELDLVSRTMWDNEKYNVSGSYPCLVYIERKESPIMYVAPTPVAAGYRIGLVGLKYSPDVLEDGGQVPHGFPESWQAFLIYTLARDIGSGPVLRLSRSDLADIKEKLAESSYLNFTGNNRPNQKRARHVKAWGL